MAGKESKRTPAPDKSPRERRRTLNRDKDQKLDVSAAGAEGGDSLRVAGAGAGDDSEGVNKLTKASSLKPVHDRAR